MRFPRIVAVFLTSMWLSVAQPVEAQRSDCDSLVGVWDYVDPSRPGRAILAPLGNNKYTFVYFQTPVPGAGGNFSAGASEYTCTGSSGKYQWKMRVLHSLIAEDVGSEQTLEMEVQGDSSEWWFIGPDGKRENPGAAKRVK